METAIVHLRSRAGIECHDDIVEERNIEVSREIKQSLSI